MREKKKKRFTWKKYHRWFGLVLSVFMLVFCVSGIILNHRQLFAGCEVSRSLMPSAYHIKNFNNGIIKGSIKINHRISKTPSDSILAYGYGGIWLTDAEMKSWKDFNKGLPKNVDGRNIRNMVQTKNGEIWCAAMMDVYRFDGKEWKMFPLADNEERIADITLTKDSTSIIAMTRSAVYEISGKKTDAANEKRDAISEKTNVTRKIIGQPEGFIPEVTLFKTVWKPTDRKCHRHRYRGRGNRLRLRNCRNLRVLRGTYRRPCRNTYRSNRVLRQTAHTNHRHRHRLRGNRYNLPAPGRCQAIFVILRFRIAMCFW